MNRGSKSAYDYVVRKKIIELLTDDMVLKDRNHSYQEELLIESSTKENVSSGKRPV